MSEFNGLEMLEPRMLLSAFVVDSLADSHDVDLSDGVAADELGRVTLRAAIEQCNALEDEGHVITFAEGLAGEILLEYGQMVVDGEVELVGPGAEALVINADDHSNHFKMGTFSEVMISGMTLTGGESYTFGGAIACYGSLVINDCVIKDNYARQGRSSNNGGGINIASNSVVEINRTIICDNAASGFGGGIYNGGKLKLRDCLIANNTAGDNLYSYLGGGIYNSFNAIADLDGVIIEGNHAYGDGGGIANYGGVLIVHNSSISNNVASGIGGGIYCDYFSGARTQTLVNTTLSGNQANSSGGIFSYVPFKVINVTIANNIASNRYGAIYVASIINNDNTQIGNTIVTGNESGEEGADIGGVFESLGHNLIDSGEGLDWLDATDLVGVDAKLLPLAANGGGVLTHRLGDGSAAIDAGDGDLAPVTDSRGFARFDMAEVVDTGVGAVTYSDIGAYEVQAPTDYEVTGRLWYDVNGDGVEDGGEMEVPWAEVRLHRDNGDGIYGMGDLLYYRAAADMDGVFVFKNIVPGDYWVVGDEGSLGLQDCEPTMDGGVVMVTVDESQPTDEARLGYQPLGTTFVVNTLDDELDDINDASDLSLREALHLANRMAGVGHVVEMFQGTISLELGQLEIDGEVELVVISEEGVVIDAGGNSRVLWLGESSDVVMSRLTITGGYEQRGDACAEGGGVYSAGKLVMNDCVIRDNYVEDSVYGSGGGIYIADGSAVEMNRTVVTGNVNQGIFGGGISNWGVLTIRDSVISNNNVIAEGMTGVGGGIYSFTGTETTLDRVAIQGNAADLGGGVFCSGRMVMANCTVAENHAAIDGGGIFCDIPSSVNSSIEVQFSTIADNTADGRGGGVYQGRYEDTEIESIVLGWVIIANNEAGEVDMDINRAVESRGFNLIGDVGAATGFVGSDLLNVDAGLGELTDGGGGMMYYPLERGSLALDGGGIEGGVDMDQLGGVRPWDGDGDGVAEYDIGAYEADYVGFGDFNSDGEVGLLDLDILQHNWGRDDIGVGFGDGDANGDGVVGLLDLDMLGREWGLVYMGLESQGLLSDTASTASGLPSPGGRGGMSPVAVDWWEIELEEEEVSLF